MQTTHDTKPIMNETTVPNGVMELWNNALNWVNEWFVEPARKRRLYRQTITELEMLDDRTLRDIGVDRCQIRSIAFNCAYGPGGAQAKDRPHTQAANDNSKNSDNGVIGTGGQRMLKAA